MLRAVGLNTGAKKRLISVDVSDSTEDRSVEEYGFDMSFSFQSRSGDNCVSASGPETIDSR